MIYFLLKSIIGKPASSGNMNVNNNNKKKTFSFWKQNSVVLSPLPANPFKQKGRLECILPLFRQQQEQALLSPGFHYCHSGPIAPSRGDQEGLQQSSTGK